MTSQVWPSSDDFADGASAYGTGVRRYLRVRPMTGSPIGLGIVPSVEGGELRRIWFTLSAPLPTGGDYAAGFHSYGASVENSVSAVVERQTYIADGEVSIVPRVYIDPLLPGQTEGHLIQHCIGVCGRVQNGTLTIPALKTAIDEYIDQPDGYYFLQVRDVSLTAEPILRLYRVVGGTWTQLATAPLADHETYVWGSLTGGAPRKMRMVIQGEGSGARIKCYRANPKVVGGFAAQAEKLIFDIFDSSGSAITAAGRWGCIGAQVADQSSTNGTYRGTVLIASLQIRNAAGTALLLRDLWHRSTRHSRHVNSDTATTRAYESRSLSMAYTGDMVGVPQVLPISSPSASLNHRGHLLADPGNDRLVIGVDPELGYPTPGATSYARQRLGWYFDQNPAASDQQHRSVTMTFLSTVTSPRETRTFGLHLRASLTSLSQVRGKTFPDVPFAFYDSYKGGYRATVEYVHVGGTTDTFTLLLWQHSRNTLNPSVLVGSADVTSLLSLGTEFKLGLEAQNFDPGGGVAVGVMARINDTDVLLTPTVMAGISVEAGWLTDRSSDATSDGPAVGMYCNINNPFHLASGLIHVNQYATEAISSGVGAQLPPIANPDPGAGNPNITVDAGQPVTISVLQNDEVFNGATADVATVTNTFQPSQGSAVVNANGTITYTAPAGPGGFSEGWRYKFSDSNGLECPSPALVTVHTNTSLAPTTVSDTAAVVSGATITIDVLLNDTRNNGSAWASSNPVVITTPPAANATASAHSTTGVITFISDAGAPEEEITLQYTATDSNGMTSSPPETVTVTVTGTTAPTAESDTSFTTSGQTIEIEVLANDTPGTGGAIDPATVVLGTGNVFGTAVVMTGADAGKVQYTAPVTSGNINDTFFYTVDDVSGNTSNSAQSLIAVTGTGQSEPPNAVDDSFFVVHSTTVTHNLTANDIPPDGGAINHESIVITLTPTNGTVNVLTGGNIEFVSAALDPAISTEFFQYTVASTAGIVSTAALVTVTVGAGGPGDPPEVVQDDATVLAGESVEINVADNDIAFGVGNTINPATVTIVTPPTEGTAVTGPTDGWITYTANESPIDLSDSLTYTVMDTAATPQTSAPGPVQLEITGSNPNGQNPTANNDIAQVVSGQSTLISILANDKAYDGATIDPLTVALTTGGLTHGATANYASGTGLVTFTSAANSPAGIQTFSYTVDDSNGWISNTATVTVYITGGDPPDPDNQPSVPVAAETEGKTGTLTTPASWPISEERVVGINSVTFDTGHRATMPVLPKERRFFGVQMLGGTHAERATLSAFFLAHRGTEIPFDWVHPLTKETIAVRFASTSIASKHRSGVGEGAEDYRFDLIEVFDATTYGA